MHLDLLLTEITVGVSSTAVKDGGWLLQSDAARVDPPAAAVPWMVRAWATILQTSGGNVLTCANVKAKGYSGTHWT